VTSARRQAIERAVRLARGNPPAKTPPNASPAIFLILLIIQPKRLKNRIFSMKFNPISLVDSTTYLISPKIVL